MELKIFSDTTIIGRTSLVLKSRGSTRQIVEIGHGLLALFRHLQPVLDIWVGHRESMVLKWRFDEWY